MERVVAVVIGLCGAYFFLSLVVAHVSEIVASAFALRARDLKKAIHDLVGDETGRRILSDPIVGGVKVRKLLLPERVPSYVANPAFAKALLNDLQATFNTTKQLAGPSGLLDAKALLEFLQTPITGEDKESKSREELRQTLWSVVDHTSTKVEHVQRDIERWFDAAMDRLSGQYKRKMQTVIFAIGFGLAAALNINTIEMVYRTWKDPEARERARNAAARFEQNCRPDATTQTGAAPDPTPNTGVQQTPGKPAPPAPSTGSAPAPTAGAREYCQQQFDLMKEGGAFPIGWASDSPSNSLLMMLFGWFLTALAVSFGAPFWFDLLKRISPVRLSGPPPKPTPPPADKT